MSTRVNYNNLVSNTVDSVIRIKISNVVVTDSNFTSTGSSTISTSGGYIVINGTSFTQDSQVVIKNIGTKISSTAVSVAYVSSSQLRVQLPSSTAGSKILFVVSNIGTTTGTTITYA
jgi:hypothetical protein